MARNPLYDAGWQARLNAAEEMLEATRRDEAQLAATSFASTAHRNAITPWRATRFTVQGGKHG